MSSADNKQIAERFIDEIFNKGNLDGVDRFVTSDFIYHARGEDVTGIENFKKWVSSDRSAFPDIRFTILDSISAIHHLLPLYSQKPYDAPLKSHLVDLPVPQLMNGLTCSRMFKLYFYLRFKLYGLVYSVLYGLVYSVLVFLIA